MISTVWFCLVAIMIAGYVVLDGFDIGAGIVHLFVARTDQERRQVLQSIGPVWDGNEVWLLAGGGTLYFAFPALYSAAFSGFYLALMMVLWLLILRGISIELRSHMDSPVWQPFWDLVFGGSSALLAILFGAALGNVVRGVPLDSKRILLLASLDQLPARQRCRDRGLVYVDRRRRGVRRPDAAWLLLGSVQDRRRFAAKEHEHWARKPGGPCLPLPRSSHSLASACSLIYRPSFWPSMGRRFPNAWDCSAWPECDCSARAAPRPGGVSVLLSLSDWHAHQRGLRSISLRPAVQHRTRSRLDRIQRLGCALWSLYWFGLVDSRNAAGCRLHNLRLPEAPIESDLSALRRYKLGAEIVSSVARTAIQIICGGSPWNTTWRTPASQTFARSARALDVTMTTRSRPLAGTPTSSRCSTSMTMTPEISRSGCSTR